MAAVATELLPETWTHFGGPPCTEGLTRSEHLWALVLPQLLQFCQRGGCCSHCRIADTLQKHAIEHGCHGNHAQRIRMADAWDCAVLRGAVEPDTKSPPPRAMPAAHTTTTLTHTVRTSNSRMLKGKANAYFDSHVDSPHSGDCNSLLPLGSILLLPHLVTCGITTNKHCNISFSFTSLH